jgi:hypothetical protein
MSQFTRGICNSKIPRYHKTRGIIGRDVGGADRELDKKFCLMQEGMLKLIYAYYI